LAIFQKNAFLRDFCGKNKKGVAKTTPLLIKLII